MIRWLLLPLWVWPWLALQYRAALWRWRTRPANDVQYSRTSYLERMRGKVRSL